MRSSDWSSDVCSSDLRQSGEDRTPDLLRPLEDEDGIVDRDIEPACRLAGLDHDAIPLGDPALDGAAEGGAVPDPLPPCVDHHGLKGLRLLSVRSEEHTSDLQSLMRISYAVLCL